MNTLYTLGYGSMSQAVVSRAIIARGALLVDTRFSPSSRIAEWRRGPLEKALGQHYVWVQALGNANYKGQMGHGQIVIHQPDEGVRYVVRRLMEREVVLMCACAQLQTCHRLVVANLVQAASGCEVKHLREADLNEWVGQQRLF